MNFYNRILMDNDGTDGGSNDDNGGDNGDDGSKAGTITLTEAKLKEIKSQNYRNGKRDGREAAKEEYASVLSELGIELSEGDVKKTVRTLAEGIKNADKNQDEKLQLEKSKNEKLQMQVQNLTKQMSDIQTEKESYIVTNEIRQALGANVVDANAALTLILNASGKKFKVEGGKVKIYNSDGEPETNSQGDPMSSGDLVKDFLKQNPYLTKPEQKDSGVSRDGNYSRSQSQGDTGSATIKESVYAAMPPEQRGEMREKIKKGLVTVTE